MENKPRVNKCVLAYSGGLDTSIIVPWLRNNYGCEVICFCANLGQTDELAGLEEKALASGASKVYVEDLRAEFLTDFAFPTMQAGALYERDYLLGTSMARPLIAKRLVDIAELEGADAVAHGATGKGNDQVRFELTVMALNPRLRIIAPWREWNIRGRKDALEYAAEYNVPVKAREDRIYSQDRNLWHLSNEGGPLEARGTSRRTICSNGPLRRRTPPTSRNTWRSTSATASRSASTASPAAQSACSTS